jgi:hypothetical protein
VTGVFVRKMNKFERVKLLERWRLNVPESVLFDMGSEIDFSDPVFKRWGNRLSIRTFPPHGSDFGTPYYFDIPIEEAKTLVPNLMANYNLVLNEPINPKYAKIAGCIMLEENRPITVEVARGAGATVRDVTSGRRIDERYTAHRPNDIGDPDIREAVSKALQIPRRNLIVEFSVYTIDIGLKKEPIIYWDYVDLNYAKQRER